MARREFTVPAGSHVICMEFDRDLPLVAVPGINELGGATLALQFSGHLGWKALAPFGLLYFDMGVDSANTLPQKLLMVSKW